jgi:hypothetical protein
VTEPTAQTQTTTEPIVTPTTEPTQTTTEPTAPPWGNDPTKFDPDKAWALIQNVKGDLAATKEKHTKDLAAAIKTATEAGAKEALAGIGKLLSGQEEPETDPVKLQAKVTDLASKISEKDGELTKAQSDLKARDLSLAVALLAPGLGGNTKLLLANEQFKTSIASVEPTDEAAVSAAITKALQANAALKATPPRSGSGEHQGATVQSLEAQLATAQKEGNWKESMRLKRAIADAKARQG